MCAFLTLGCAMLSSHCACSKRQHLGTKKRDWMIANVSCVVFAVCCGCMALWLWLYGACSCDCMARAAVAVWRVQLYIVAVHCGCMARSCRSCFQSHNRVLASRPCPFTYALHTNAHTHKLTHTRTHAHTHAHSHIHTHSHRYTHAHAHAHAHTHTCTRTHTRTHTHTYTHALNYTPYAYNRCGYGTWTVGLLQ